MTVLLEYLDPNIDAQPLEISPVGGPDHPQGVVTNIIPADTACGIETLATGYYSNIGSSNQGFFFFF